MKKTLIVSGIVLVWVGGAIVAFKAGDLIGKGVGKVCVKATNKLLTLA